MQRSSIPLAAALVALTLGFLTGPARAQAPDGVRLGAYALTALGGDVDADIGSSHYTWGLDPTVGLGARVDVPIHEVLAVGGSFEARFLDWGSDRKAILDVDVSLRLRSVFEVEPAAVWLEPYASVSAGLSLGMLGSVLGEDVWPGYNVGVVTGAWLLLNLPISFFAEVGWRHHLVVTHSPEVGDVVGWTQQLAIHLGAAVVLD